MYSVYPVIRVPNLHIVKMGYKGVYLFLLQSIDRGYPIESVPIHYVLSKNNNNNNKYIYIYIYIYIFLQLEKTFVHCMGVLS